MGAARDPGPLEAAVSNARDVFAVAQATAPPELAGDIDVLAGAFGQLFDGMEAAGYELRKVSPGAFSALRSSEVTAAENRFNQYIADVC